MTIKLSSQEQATLKKWDNDILSMIRNKNAEKETPKMQIKKKIRHKFNAKRTELDGFKFDSKREGEEYLKLKALKEKGEILFFLMQTPVHIGSPVKFKCDFLIFWADGSVEFREVKSKPTLTALYKTKKNLVENLYPFTINEVF